MGKTATRGGSMKTTFNQNKFSNVAFCTQNRKTTVKAKHENTKKVAAVRSRRRISDNAIIAILSLITVFAAIYIAYQYTLHSTLWRENARMNGKCNSSKLRLLIIAENSKAINHAFDSLDYEIVHDIRDNWDILWSTAADSFNLNATDHNIAKLKPHQLVVNQFPPALSSHYTNIMTHMFTDTHLEFIKHAFKLPEMKQELMNYERKYPNKKFIIRDCVVNGTKVINSDDNINYDASLVVHEFVTDPLLIDENAIIKLGIYVLVSSLNPLRIYRYDSEVNAKFIRNYQKLPKYFCFESSLSSLDISSLSKYIQFSVKDSINSYLLAKGYNVKTLYENIDNAITSFFIKDEDFIINQSKGFSNLHQFIQLMQFNFVMDKNLNVYITDVDAVASDYGIEKDYERIIYSALKLIGAGSSYDFHCRENLECPVLSTTKDIVVNANSCINYPCNESSCSSFECELCFQCLNQVPDALNHLHRSFREHMQCGNMRRIFPSQKYYNYHDDDDDDDRNIVNQLSPANRLSMNWFKAKCYADSAWC